MAPPKNRSAPLLEKNERFHGNYRWTLNNQRTRQLSFDEEDRLFTSVRDVGAIADYVNYCAEMFDELGSGGLNFIYINQHRRPVTEYQPKGR